MDFDRDMKKICILIAAVIALEIPVFFLWKYVSGGDEQSHPDTVHLASEPAETEIPLEFEVPSVDFSLPEFTQPTEAILETIPAETSVQQTDVLETIPEESTLQETEPEKYSFDQVPQYYQNDYPDEPYSYSTVANSGSSMTALAMVATYMTDHPYYPDQMADWLAHYLGGDYQRLEYGSDLLQLNWKRALNVHEGLQAVRDGKIAIFRLTANSIFGNERYLVVTGVNSDGTFQVMDTEETHFGSTWLNQLFENGFTAKQLTGGYSASWVYDKSSMPEDPFIYEPEPPAEKCRYGDLVLTEAEKHLLARLICMEAGSEPFEGQQAVAEVVLNRLHSGRFQSSIYNVIHAPDQFPSVPNLYLAEPSYSQYKAIEQALNGPYVLPDDVVFFAKFKVNENLWGKIGSHYFCFSY